MLVLTRKQGEAVVIGANVRLTVVAISGGSVRLGLSAPADVPILREELDVQGERGRGRQAGGSSHGRYRQDGGVRPSCAPRHAAEVVPRRGHQHVDGPRGQPLRP